MKSRVMLVRPKRTATATPARTSKQASSAVVRPDLELSGQGGVNYPSIEGVIINPLSRPEGKKKQGVEEILALAADLDLAARKTLLARLSLLALADKPAERDLDMWSAAVLQALGDVIGSGEGPAHAPLVVRRTMAAASAWTPVTEFMSAARLTGLEVSRRQSVYYMLARLLVQYAHQVSKKVKAPLTPKFVAQCTQHLAAIFDNAYPGYLRAGVVAVVADQLTKTRNKE